MSNSLYYRGSSLRKSFLNNLLDVCLYMGRIYAFLVMHLSMACPTIPLPRKTKGYQGVLTGEAGPRVGHLTFLCILMQTICKLEGVVCETMIATS